MSRLYFIRHGETEWNRLRKLQGHTDIPLNEQGRAQAQSLKPLLHDLNLDSWMSSDLKRAHETAVIGQPQSPPRTTKALREIFLGEAEGLTREEIQMKWPELWSSWSDWKFSSYEMTFPGGETRKQSLERLFHFLTEQKESLSGQLRFGCFTHGLLLRTFAQWAQGSEEAVFSTPNCCVYEWEWTWRELRFDSPIEVRPKLRQIHLLPEGALSL